ncbi:MAG: RHS repeat domain-containing protein [Thermoleophilia bacterium]|jgi:YD repeat-containing protein
MKLGARAEGDKISVYKDEELKASFSNTAPYSFSKLGFSVCNATVLFDDMREDGLTSYTYDAADQLLQVTNPSGTITYTDLPQILFTHQKGA